MNRRPISIALGVLWVAAFVALTVSQFRNEKGPDALGFFGMGAMVLVFLISFVGRSIVQQRMETAPASFEETPAALNLARIANRCSQSLAEEFPEDVGQVVWNIPVDKVERIIVGLTGVMGEKLLEPFAGDPAGAWMLSEPERTRMSRMRAIVDAYTKIAGSIANDPLIVFDSNVRLTDEVRRDEQPV